jgi:Putative zinc-finger
MTDESQKSSESWQACPPGTLGRVARQVKITNSRRVFFKAAGVVIPLLLVAGLAFHFYTTQDIGCSKAYGMLNGYLDNDLTATERKQLEAHLASCDKCTRAFENLKASRPSLVSRFVNALLLTSTYAPLSSPGDLRQPG